MTTFKWTSRMRQSGGGYEQGNERRYARFLSPSRRPIVSMMGRSISGGTDRASSPPAPVSGAEGAQLEGSEMQQK